VPFSRRFAFLSVLSGLFSVLAVLSFSPAASANSLPWVEHSVRSGESVAFIAGKYGVSPRTIERANELAVREDDVLPGEKLLVPKKDSDLLTTLAEYRARQRGETLVPMIRIEEPLPPPPPSKKEQETLLADGTEPLMRPLDGRVSSPFGKRGRRLHDGIDIPARAGTPILAVRSGRVIFSGVIRGFGNTVTIDHGNGFVTRYSHNSANLAKKGAWVRRGQPVAKVGKTGRTTCNHLHFSVLVRGKPVNPEKYLPKQRQ